MPSLQEWPGLVNLYHNGSLIQKVEDFPSYLKSKKNLTRFCSGPGSAFPLRIILDILNLFSVSLENSHEWLVLCSAKISANSTGFAPSFVQDQNKNNLPEILFDECIHGRAALVGWKLIFHFSSENGDCHTICICNRGCLCSWRWVGGKGEGAGRGQQRGQR